MTPSPTDPSPSPPSEPPDWRAQLGASVDAMLAHLSAWEASVGAGPCTDYTVPPGPERQAKRRRCLARQRAHATT